MLKFKNKEYFTKNIYTCSVCNHNGKMKIKSLPLWIYIIIGFFHIPVLDMYFILDKYYKNTPIYLSFSNNFLFTAIFSVIVTIPFVSFIIYYLSINPMEKICPNCNTHFDKRGKFKTILLFIFGLMVIEITLYHLVIEIYLML